MVFKPNTQVSRSCANVNTIDDACDDITKTILAHFLELILRKDLASELFL